MRIDAHQHFWRYSPAAYGWIDGHMTRLRRDFLPADLESELVASGFEGTIAVQARASLDENRFLLDLAGSHPWILGVVGWLDLCAPDVEAQLERWAPEPRLCGLRHLVQDEPDPDFLLRPDFLRGVGRLAEHGLVYDLLIRPPQLEVARAFLERLPEQPMVLDHLAKPDIAGGTRAPWERGFRALGDFPLLACKVSGLVTEAAWERWQPADLRFYLDVALETFGEERLLFGSDWPVCLLAARDHAQVAEALLDWSETLTPAGRLAFFGGNALRHYGLARPHELS